MILYIMRRTRSIYVLRDPVSASATGQVVSVSGENKTAATTSRARTWPTTVEFGCVRCGDGGVGV